MDKIRILTKLHLIEGQILPENTKISISEKLSKLYYTTTIDQIANFDRLPKDVQAKILRADEFSSLKIKDLIGYEDGHIIWSATGNWERIDKFILKSLVQEKEFFTKVYKNAKELI